MAQRPGPYQLLAALNAVQDDAVAFADTGWPQIVTSCARPLALDASPVVALKRTLAVAEVDGPEGCGAR